MHRLEMRDIRKSFNGKTAVQNTEICLENGVYGLLGENGAGKTTLMRMMCGILKPDCGEICCDGIEIGQLGRVYRSMLGYLPQDPGFYGDFTALRFLHYMAALKALPGTYASRRIDELLELVDLKAFQKQKLKTFSGGMLKRVGIAQALLNDPEILILDEPTAGLDPKERVRFRNIISSLGRERIVLLSTHIVTDVDYIADEILIMRKGEIIAKGTESQLRGSMRDIVWKCTVPEADERRFSENYIVSNLRRCEGGVELRIVSGEKPAVGALPAEPTLEDIYLWLIREDKGISGGNNR